MMWLLLCLASIAGALKADASITALNASTALPAGAKRAGGGGHISGASLIYVSPLVSTAQANQSMSEIAAYVRSQGGTAVVKQYPSFLAFYEENVISNSVSVGSPRFSDLHIIPQSVFKSAGGLVGEEELRQAVGDQAQV